MLSLVLSLPPSKCTYFLTPMYNYKFEIFTSPRKVESFSFSIAEQPERNSRVLLSWTEVTNVVLSGPSDLQTT